MQLKITVGVAATLFLAVIVSAIVFGEKNGLQQVSKGALRIDKRQENQTTLTEGRMVKNQTDSVENLNSSQERIQNHKMESNPKSQNVTEGQSQPSQVKCRAWNHSSDDWWQNHPDYEIDHETLSHTCFSPIKNETKAEFFRQLHQLQFHGNCSEVHSRFIVGSGFAASIRYLQDGFWCSYRQGKPFQRSKHWEGFRWMYSPPFNSSKDPGNNVTSSSWAACKSQDMFCYLPPISSCTYEIGKNDPTPRAYINELRRKPDAILRHDWMLSYMMRPRHHVRKRVIDLLHSSAPKYTSLAKSSSCTAMHVRRTDATTEKNHPRNYYPLSMYIEKGNIQEGETILLLTDDQSAIEEAHAFHPNYNWVYLERIRHRGNAGRNSHIPSNDPALEVLVILAEFRLSAYCRKLVHGTSNMVSMFLHVMQERRGETVEAVQIDKDIDFKLTPMVQGSVFMHELNQKLQNSSSSIK